MTSHDTSSREDREAFARALFGNPPEHHKTTHPLDEMGRAFFGGPTPRPRPHLEVPTEDGDDETNNNEQTNEN